MQRVVLAGEGLGEIGIALPVGGLVAIGEARPAVAVALGCAAMGQRIGPGVDDWILAGRGIAGKVALLFGGVAPRAVGVPVPGFHLQLSVLAVAYRAPARAQQLLKRRAAERPLRVPLDFFAGLAAAQAVHGAAESARRAEGVYRV